jgi:D-3-phosphoglycerate dehydrogenase
MKIVLYDQLGFGREQLDMVCETAAAAQVVLSDKDRLPQDLAEAEIFFGYHSPEVFAGAPRLRWIQATAAGLDRLLTPELVVRDVIVTNASAVHGPAVAEMAWALTLSLARGLPTFFRQQQQHVWKWGPLADLASATAGIVGLGGIGRQYARVAGAFDMRVVAVDPHVTAKPDGIAELWPMDGLPELLRQSDFVLISCPYTDQTHNLIDRRALALMKPTAFLINIARGGIVDEAALTDALRGGRLAGAGLDVCETEPLPADSPLWDCPNLVLTPHCAGLSSHRMRRLTELFCDNLKRYLAGQPLRNLVDKTRGYPVPSGA